MQTDPTIQWLAKLASPASVDVGCPPSDQLPNEILALARYHGILPLIASYLAQHVAPAWIVEAATNAKRSQAAIELARRPMVVEAIDALTAAGAEPILLKGEALAQTHYADSWQRPRADTDLLVAPATQEQAASALIALGYQPVLQLPGKWVSSQASLVRIGPSGFKHAIDLHWRINNSPVLASLLSHGEIRATAMPLPSLGQAARAPSQVHALLIACLHRVGSEHAPYHVDGIARVGGDRLIWLADIDRLLRSFDGSHDELVQLAAERGCGRLCAAGITSAAGAFATPGAQALVIRLGEPSIASIYDRYLVAGSRQRGWLDFQALPGIQARLSFLNEALWPDQAYLCARYPNVKDPGGLRFRLSRIFNGLRSRLR